MTDEEWLALQTMALLIGPVEGMRVDDVRHYTEAAQLFREKFGTVVGVTARRFAVKWVEKPRAPTSVPQMPWQYPLEDFGPDRDIWVRRDPDDG